MKFEERYRKEMPQTIGEKDHAFDLANYSEWLERRIESLEQAMEHVRDNTLNPAHTMTVLGLECSVDACHRIALRELDPCA